MVNILTKPVSSKEARQFVRRQAREAQIWAMLDEQLGEDMTLDRTLAAAQAERESLAKALQEAKADIEKARAEADAIRADARGKADGIIGEANNVKADAEKRAAEADAIVVDAQSEADRLIAVGRQKGEQAAEEAGGKLQSLRQGIQAATAERTKLANDIAALEKRRNDAISDMAKLRDKIA